MCATGKKIKEGEVTECYKIKCGHLRNVNIFCLFVCFSQMLSFLQQIQLLRADCTPETYKDGEDLVTVHSPLPQSTGGQAKLDPVGVCSWA